MKLGAMGLPPWAIDCRPFGAKTWISPEGAAVNSPGREPWEEMEYVNGPLPPRLPRLLRPRPLRRRLRPRPRGQRPRRRRRHRLRADRQDATSPRSARWPTPTSSPSPTSTAAGSTRARAVGGGSPRYADFRKLLDDKDVEAVVVATPDHWHALMTMLACAAGKDVYVEKPLTLFVREGEWMHDVAGGTKRVVQVGTQQRSGKHYQKARRPDPRRAHRHGHLRADVGGAQRHRRASARPPDGDAAGRTSTGTRGSARPRRGSTTRTAACTTSAGSGTTPAGR